MTCLDRLLQLPLWADVPPATLRSLEAAATVVQLKGGDYLARQHHPARDFHLLLDGRVEFLIQVDDSGEWLSVGTVERPLTPMGWSGLRPPHRFAADIRCLTPCTLIRWPRGRLAELLEGDSLFGLRFMGLVLESGNELLRQSRNLLEQCARSPWDREAALAHQEEADHAPGPELLERLRSAPFFEAFTEEQLRKLVPLALTREYRRGERLFGQGEAVAGFYLLERGAVALYFTAGERELLLRTVSNPGQVVDWAGVVPGRRHEYAAVAMGDSRLHFFPLDALEAVLTDCPLLALALARRLLWLLGNHLRSIRVQIIVQRYDRERLAVRNLLAQAGAQLGVHSPLHKVPHLLGDRLTLEDAFASLQFTRREGTALERSLAGLCLDILRDTGMELSFFKGLQEVYETVANSPPERDPGEVRRRSAEIFARLFAATRHRLAGLEHLPGGSGHIFVLNHLANHPYNTLPNGFQLTLDAHFVSSMILLPRYGDPGVRVVRRGRGEEYGHQGYYDRLGHIYVHTGESGPRESGDSRDGFLRQAKAHLAAGRNLVICPEGTSRPTRESPGPFRPGAFRLAAALDPEPLIVPVAVVNFDRRLRQTTLGAVVQAPFRVSERVDGTDPRALALFLEDLCHSYKGYVREALELTEFPANS